MASTGQKKPVSIIVPLFVIALSLTFAIEQMLQPTQFEQEAVTSSQPPAVETRTVILPTEQSITQSPVPSVVINPTKKPILSGLVQTAEIATSCTDCSPNSQFRLTVTVQQDSPATVRPIQFVMVIPSSLNFFGVEHISNGTCQIVRTVDTQIICNALVGVNLPITMWVNVSISDTVANGSFVTPDPSINLTDITSNTATARATTRIKAKS